MGRKDGWAENFLACRHKACVFCDCEYEFWAKPALPYDPDEQGDPMHTVDSVAPAERISLSTVWEEESWDC
jgi:hypothetical protein